MKLLPENSEYDHTPAWLWWQNFAQHVGHEWDDDDLLKGKKGGLIV
jgi:hypothetical protein